MAPAIKIKVMLSVRGVEGGQIVQRKNQINVRCYIMFGVVLNYGCGRFVGMMNA